MYTLLRNEQVAKASGFNTSNRSQDLHAAADGLLNVMFLTFVSRTHLLTLITEPCR